MFNIILLKDILDRYRERLLNNSAEGATTPETLRQKGPIISITLWKEIYLADGAKLSGKNTDGVKWVL